MRLRHAAVTEVGPVRQRNEDAFGFHLPLRLFVVADGMGGHEGGDVASRLAVRTVEQHFERSLGAAPAADGPAMAGAARDRLVAAIQAANQQIFSQPVDGHIARRMGTTLVAAHFLAGFVVVAHAGDSRCYRLRAGALELLTRDHSFAEDVRSGRIELGADEAQVIAAYAHVVTRAVGLEPDLEVEALVSDALPGDVFLLCSDGLSGVVPEAQLVECMAQPVDLEARCGALIAAATQAGTADNVTAVLVAIDG
jgi:PPM family protein phosphatase